MHHLCKHIRKDTASTENVSHSCCSDCILRVLNGLNLYQRQGMHCIGGYPCAQEDYDLYKVVYLTYVGKLSTGTVGTFGAVQKKKGTVQSLSKLCTANALMNSMGACPTVIHQQG